jgi:hypothetical protein
LNIAKKVIFCYITSDLKLEIKDIFLKINNIIKLKIQK